MIYYHSGNVMNTSDWCCNRINTKYFFQNNKKQELPDLKASSDVFMNGFNGNILVVRLPLQF